MHASRAGPETAVQGPEVRRWSGTPGLRAVPWHASDAGWDSRTQSDSMVWGTGVGRVSRVSQDYAQWVTSIYIKIYFPNS